MYHRRLENAQSQLDHELDLKKFIGRQRMQTTALLSLLSGQQTLIATKMSRLIVDVDKKK